MRFNLVGAAGYLLQVLVLAGCTGWLGWHYLPATAAAVGAAIVHNFAWHVRWTWADRRCTGARLARAFVWFAGGNGAVSMAGNLALMPVLVELASAPVLAANAIAVAVCGLANYWISDNVSFRRSSKHLDLAVVDDLEHFQIAAVVPRDADIDRPRAVLTSRRNLRLHRVRDDHAPGLEDRERLVQPRASVSPVHGEVPAPHHTIVLAAVVESEC